MSDFPPDELAARRAKVAAHAMAADLVKGGVAKWSDLRDATISPERVAKMRAAAEAEAKKIGHRPVLVVYCQGKGCAAKMETFTHGMPGKEILSVMHGKARGWFISTGLPPVVLCPTHSAGMPGRIGA